MKVSEQELEKAKADEQVALKNLEEARQRYNEYCASHPEC